MRPYFHWRLTSRDDGLLIPPLFYSLGHVFTWNSVWRCMQRERRDHAVLPAGPWVWFCHDVQAAEYRYPLQQAICQGRTLLVWLLRSAEQPTYFPMWCWGKRSVDHQSLKFSFSSCGYIRSC